MDQLTWKVGGAQGEGIDSTGEILSTVLNRIGYYTFAYRHFMSLIKGGHTNYKIRISHLPVYYHGDQTDVLIAFDQRTIDENKTEFHQNTLVIYDSKFEPQNLDNTVNCGVPMSEFAEELGNVIIKNMVAIGVTAAVLDIDPQLFHAMVETRFAKKGDKVISLNKTAIQQGYDYYRKHYNQIRRLPDIPKQKSYMQISGNEAVAFGALAGGCRFFAAYPITPATEIMYWLVNHLPEYGGRVVQAEDEIAACLMAIGSNYTGVRAMTSTSGPGFSLMQEAIGLAGIAETPLVIVNVQRGGPATGLPTKTEQSDLNEILYGSHGEIPRIVIAPATIEECFYYTVEAFNLAEKYQCVVLIASDLYLGMSKQGIPALNFSKVLVKREGFISDEELSAIEPGTYKRYALTDSGISPRSIPGQSNGMHAALSNEHDQIGREEAEDPYNRVTQMNKRFRKIQNLSPNTWEMDYSGPDNPDLLLLGWGSTYAQLNEAREMLEKQGRKAAHLQLRLLAPFPHQSVKEKIQQAQKCLIVENNYTAQLRLLIQREIGFNEKFISHNRYDGNPLTVNEIVLKANEVLQ